MNAVTKHAHPRFAAIVRAHDRSKSRSISDIGIALRAIESDIPDTIEDAIEFGRVRADRREKNIPRQSIVRRFINSISNGGTMPIRFGIDGCSAPRCADKLAGASVPNPGFSGAVILYERGHVLDLARRGPADPALPAIGRTEDATLRGGNEDVRFVRHIDADGARSSACIDRAGGIPAGRMNGGRPFKRWAA